MFVSEKELTAVVEKVYNKRLDDLVKEVARLETALRQERETSATLRNRLKQADAAVKFAESFQAFVVPAEESSSNGHHSV